ncbi:Mobile element protein [hydrothermal vent metagenome]|uniref:Mobile element protein n=1 Tax=hydrothermal vent metagenome TaxID=652676 RepID=A0A3B1E415_9ZZZZ
MAIRQNKAMGFVDVMLAGGPRSAAMLKKLDEATPWDELAAPIAALPEYNNEGPGRPPWEPVMMLKCLMLAKWNNLSDPGLEEALQDRISFRRFVGLSFADEAPDETTFVKFLARLLEAEIHEHIFDTVVKHLDSQGFLVREGTMVDATIIEQSRGRARGDGTSTRDPDASFTKKHSVSHHGYKGHIACDLSGLATDYRFGTAREHDSRQIDDLTLHEQKAALADSAYSSASRRAELHRRGVLDGICYKRNRGQALFYDWQVRWNQAVSRLRARVEHPFGMLKQQFGYRRVRYRGRARNEFDFALLMTACNLKKSLSLR